MGARPRNSTSNATSIAHSLASLYPDAHVELDHANAFELLVATILAAQSTDKMINTITPALFAKYPTARALAAATPEEVEPMVFKSGFYRAKAKSLLGMARALVERHGGEVPRTMEKLVELPGVARKTANVILGSAFRQNVGVVVDTHVTRLAQRFGLSKATDPVGIEQDLMKSLPQDQWTDFAHRVIWHGRRVCFAKAPACDSCTLAPICPSAFLDAKPARSGKPATTKKPAAKPAPKRPGRGKVKA